MCAQLLQSCLTLCDPMDCSLPGSSVCADSPGKTTGVGCHALLHGILPTQGSNTGFLHYRWILYHLSHQRSPIIFFATPWTVAHQAPLSMGIVQARTLEWVAMPSSRGFFQPGIKPRSLTLQADSLPAKPPGKPKNTGEGSLSLLQGIFPTQESNQGLLHCRWILYQLSYQGNTQSL